MTDITELAQREKFEAWAEEAGALPWGILGKHRNQDGNYPGPHYTYMWKAWQAASAELVEALEKAQQHIARHEQILLNQDESLSIRRGELEKAQSQSSKWLEAYHKAVSIGARYEERIAELEEAERKLCAANVTLDARAEQAERERENWRTSFDNERLRADKLKAHIDEMTEEQTASINELSRIIQREIKAKREAEKRIAELESRTVTVKLPTTRLWAGVAECYEKSDVIAAILSAGMEVSDD